jgi:phosphoserine phosphatase
VAGRKVVILSGNLSPVLDVFAAALDCECSATMSSVYQGRYTGLVVGVPCVAKEKVARVRGYVDNENLEESFGYGNSRNDIHFLEILGHPYAVTPDSVLLKRSIESGWSQKFVTVDEPILSSSKKQT